jgi:hypothetical protein
MAFGSLALLFIALFGAWFWAGVTRPILARKAAGPISTGIGLLLTSGLVVVCAIGLAGWTLDIATPLAQVAFDLIAVPWLVVVFLGWFDRYAIYLRLTGGR